MSTEVLSKKAVAYFRSGYNCAQSVLLALTGKMDPKPQTDVIPKIAAGFGSGVGGCGSICGALVGGVLAIGLEYGSNDSDPKKRFQAGAYARKLYSQFETQHGCVLCRELKANKKVCAVLVESVVEAYLALDKH
jgi:C_GCAxxG_C_C family probable redox protein